MGTRDGVSRIGLRAEESGPDVLIFPAGLKKIAKIR
jgi:hypothetical protein